jgi:DNA-binding CsgD family transcriptional regulator
MPRLEQAARRFADDEFPVETSLRWGWLTVVPTYALWDEASTHTICLRHLEALRRAGALARLPLHLATFNLLAVRCGDLAGAEGAAAESDALAEATGTGIASRSAMIVGAFRGREAEARALIEAVRREASALGQGIAVELTEWLLALLCNGLGRYDEAKAAARGVGSDGDKASYVKGALELGSGVAALTALELLEAATRTNDAEAARVALERIVAATAHAPTDSALGILARSRALVSEGAVADGLYREAIERLGHTRLRPDLARAHLLYGEWLRRESRRVEAREQLRMAYAILDAIGMEAFAERARRELQATGEKVRRRTVETRDELTAQELQIARLARDGLSNPVIGAQLFLSPRTVEWHLHNVFAKLGIRSRRELADALS